MNTLTLLGKAINALAYKKAMKKANLKKNIRTWGRLEKKLKEFFGKERDKIIQRIVNGGK